MKDIVATEAIAVMQSKFGIDISSHLSWILPTRPSMSLRLIFSKSLFMAFLLSCLDFGIHFVVDRLKTKIKTNLKTFWWVLGGDQAAHYIFYVFLALIIGV